MTYQFKAFGLAVAFCLLLSCQIEPVQLPDRSRSFDAESADRFTDMRLYGEDY